ncbi:MAG: (2Fe-2S)-binding protein [Actinobacteria bacterium]|nr:(2Fe-2S)-binding protein [Actinomycetota bacterium]MCL5447181.1 (2Fe-2S)-binding protein [Actinomycetota bacterium]
MRVDLRINGRNYVLPDIWIGENLLYVLRERLGLPGSKNACEQGECGSCSVLVDGVLVCACLVPAADASGREITTVEGLGRTLADPADSSGKHQEVQEEELTQQEEGVQELSGPAMIASSIPMPQLQDISVTDGMSFEGVLSRMHPVQQAFVMTGAIQCGFCTPGLVVAIADLLNHNPHPSSLQVREAISGNLCRCTGYGRIFAAVRRAEELLAGTA